MKTTIDVSDALLDAAKLVAKQEHTTLRALVEEGLRDALRKREAGRCPFALRDGSVGGEGVQPGIDSANWSQIAALAYDDRGAWSR